MRDDLTCIHYTANIEQEPFATNVRRSLLETIGDLPLISVSQKPLDFGENICVGEVGISGQNALRQWQIGAKAARTRFICPAESDFLYPREYFEFRPERDDVFHTAYPVYVIFAQHGKERSFYRLPRAEAAVVVGRDYLISAIDRSLAGKGTWSNGIEHWSALPNIFLGANHQHFKLSTPIVTFKTDQGMHRKCPYSRSSRTRTLPGWGSSDDLLRRYFT